MENNYASKEMLRYLDIRNIFFRSDGGITSVVQPLFIELRNMVVISGNRLQETGALVIVTQTAEYRIPVKTERTSSLAVSACWTLVYLDVVPDAFAEKIIELKKIMRKSGRRAEERFDIGMKRWQQFGLISPMVDMHVENQHVRCVVSNASFHGALLTGERSSARIGSPCRLICAFADGVVTQCASIVNAANTKNSGTYYDYSLHFLEPVSIMWQKQLNMFIGE